MRGMLFLMVTVVLGVQPLVAQGPGGGMGGMGGRGGRGGMGGRPTMGRRNPTELPSEDVMRGPLVPDSMSRKFGLDTAQAARYQASWDSMMAATRPVRDSVHETMDGMRRARTEGYDHEGARQSQVLQHLGKALQKQDERFDGVIRRILTKDQWGDFKDWRKRRRETEKQLRQQEMIDGGTGRRGRGGRGGGN